MTDSYDCPRCSIGVCHPALVPYTRIHQSHVVNMPITRYTCDVCGFHELDIEALHELFEVLGQTRFSGSEANGRKPAAPPTAIINRRKARNANT